MKKLSLILLMAALALPMLAQMTATSKALSSADRNVRTLKQNVMNPFKAFDWTLQSAAQTRADALYEWDFEDDEDFEGWSMIDADGDGECWTTDDTYGHNGPNCMWSYSWNGQAYSPDNWLISPEVPLGGTLTVWAMNYSSSYPEHFAIYVCEGTPSTLNDFVQVTDDIQPPTSWTEYTVDLSEFAGKVGCFAIRHYGTTDMYRLYIDDISLTAAVPDAPENLAVVPDVNTADVSWTDDNNVGWNLRYMEIVPGSENNLLWDFEEDTNGNENTELTGGWTSIDADGDGYEWYHLYGSFNNHSGKGHVTSASYQSVALTPDNWLISPEVKLDGKLSFWAAGQDPAWAGEVFAVYVNVGGDPTNTADFVLISDPELVATGEMTEFEFDLTGYEGAMGYVAIRHYNITDMFRLNIDDIAITYVEPAEWIYLNEVTNPYTIDGLKPETNYVVQVQGLDEEGAASPWTESVAFTTLPEPVVTVPNVYLLGLVNDQNWAPNVGTMMTYNEENKIYTATVNLDADETFGFTTELAEYDDQGSWDYIEPFRFGPESNGDFYLFEEFVGQPLTLTFDNYGAIKVLETAEYNITVDLENNVIIVDKVVPAVEIGDVDMDGFIKISDVTALINYLLNNDPTGIDLQAADCDHDGFIKINDVTTLINYLLNGTW